MNNTTCFLCGKKIIGNEIIQSYFIPTDICKAFSICRMNSVDNKIHICSRCNKQKGKRILFPPMRADLATSYVPDEHVEHLKKIQFLFEKLCVEVVRLNNLAVKDSILFVDTDESAVSQYWSRWLHDYKRIWAKTSGTSIFDKKKVFIDTDIKHLINN